MTDFRAVQEELAVRYHQALGKVVALWPAAFGGTAGALADPCSDVACDTIANLSDVALDQMSDAVAHAVATLAAVGGALLLLLPLLFYPQGVGMGDVKLMLLIGAALGSAVVTAILVGSLAAGGYAAVVLLRGGSRTAFAFGPFLVFGALVALYLQ